MMQIRKSIQYALVSVILGGLTSAMACAQTRDQTRVQVEAPSPVALALVREMPGQVTGEGFLDGMRRKLMAGPRHGLSPSQLDRLVDGIVMPEFQAHFPELETVVAEIWSSRFSRAELAELLAFVRGRTPERQQQFIASTLGKKYLAQQAEMTSAHRQAAGEWTIRVTRLAFARHSTELRAMGIDPDTGENLPTTK